MDLSEVWARFHDQIIGLIAALPTLAVALIIFAIFFIVAKQSRRLVTHTLGKRPHTRNVGLVLGRLSQGLVTLLGMLVALSVALPEFGAGQLIELLGIGSVAIGFAFRDILQNFLAGILLLLTKPFGIGDQIIVNEFEGTEETDGDRLRQREGWRAPTGPVPLPRSIAGSLGKLAEAHMHHDGSDRARHTKERV